MNTTDTNDTELKKIMRFGMVGGLGFVTDGGLLQLGIMFFGWGPLIARIPSFLTAVLVTWYLNRRFTFRAAHKSFRDSFPAYIAANALGLGINIGTYTICILAIPLMTQWPLVPLAIGSGLAMVANFLMIRLIFRQD